MRLLFVSFLAMILVACCVIRAGAAPVQRNIVYATVGSTPLCMDVLRPPSVPDNAVLPVVVCIHGGGWSSGHKEDMLGLGAGIAALGFEVITVDYRLAPAHPWPSQIDDVMSACKYIRAHQKELHVDTSRMAAFGGSAGGHLALMLAERNWDGTAASARNPSMLRAAISFDGPTDLLQDIPPLCSGVVTGLLGCTAQENIALYKQASPIHGLNVHCAPMLLIHGDKDPIVPYVQAVRLAAACKRAGVPAQLVTLHGAGHSGEGGSDEERKASFRMLGEFLNSHLRHR